MSQPKKPTSPFKNRNFIIVLVMLLMLFVMFPLTGKSSEQDMTRTEFLAMMGDSTKVITELTLQKTPDGIIIEGAYQMSPEEIAKANEQRSALAALPVPTRTTGTPSGSRATCWKFQTSRLPPGKCSRASR